jgi:two-component system sensor histidine kinase RegB
MFLVYVTLAAFFLNARWTWWALALSSAGYSALFFIHRPLPGLEVHHHASGGFSLHLHGMLLAFLVIGFLLSLFLTRMSRALDQQAQQIAALEKRRSLNENFISIATLAAGAAHELSTPIGTLTLIAEDMVRDLQHDPRWKTDVVLMKEQLERCGAILGGMRGRGVEVEAEPSAPIVIGDIVSLFKREFPSVSFTTSTADSHLVCPRSPLFDSLRSLVKNAVQASPQAVRCSFDSLGDSIRLAIEDEGWGMDAATLGLGLFSMRCLPLLPSGTRYLLVGFSGRSCLNGTSCVLLLGTMGSRSSCKTAQRFCQQAVHSCCECELKKHSA